MGGRVTSLFALAERVDLRLVNKKVLEGLAKACAFDSLAPGANHRLWRARLVAGLDRIIDHGGRHQRDRDQGQTQLFGDDHHASAPLDDAAGLPDAPAWSEAEALGFEKEALGLYITGHPLQRFADVLAAAGARRLADLTQSEADCAIGGLVTGLRPLKTKRGDRMCVFMLEDDTNKVEAVVFPEAVAKHGALVVDDALLLVRGKYERDDESSRLVVSEITPLAAVQERVVREVEIRLSGRRLDRDIMRTVAGILDRHPGDRRVSVLVELNGDRHLRVRAGTARRNRPSDHFVKDVEAVCGAGSVILKQ
jgi:DNA polymerase-3 subunit alpha